jgi:hypothetical protein
VVGVEFDRERRCLDLGLDFPKASGFACPECRRAGCGVRDTEEKTWRHLDFFEHHAGHEDLTDRTSLKSPSRHGQGEPVLTASTPREPGLRHTCNTSRPRQATR